MLFSAHKLYTNTWWRSKQWWWWWVAVVVVVVVVVEVDEEKEEEATLLMITTIMSTTPTQPICIIPRSYFVVMLLAEERLHILHVVPVPNKRSKSQFRYNFNVIKKLQECSTKNTTKRRSIVIVFKFQHMKASHSTTPHNPNPVLKIQPQTRIKTCVWCRIFQRQGTPSQLCGG